ncbi:MAG: hypothetical protein V7K84_07525 [Nostoc sp.]
MGIDRASATDKSPADRYEVERAISRRLRSSLSEKHFQEEPGNQESPIAPRWWSPLRPPPRRDHRYRCTRFLDRSLPPRAAWNQIDVVPYLSS